MCVSEVGCKGFVFVCEKLEMAVFKYLVLLHTDVPKAAQFYAHGLGLAVNVCTLRWAELQSGPCKIALMQAPRYTSPSRSISQFFSWVKSVLYLVLKTFFFH